MIFSIILSAIGASSVLVRHIFLTGKRAWLRAYYPNFLIFAMGFTMDDTVYGTAMTMGSLLAWSWQRRFPRNFDMHGYAVAAGGVAGEGFGGVINALLMVTGLGFKGVSWACPPGKC